MANPRRFRKQLQIRLASQGDPSRLMETVRPGLYLVRENLLRGVPAPITTTYRGGLNKQGSALDISTAMNFAYTERQK